MNTLRELCQAPENVENFPAERLARIEHELVEDHRSDMPWYLRVIVGIGAWIASLFFIGFVGTLVGWEDKDHAAFGAMGVVFLVAAVVVGRQKWGVFAEQCALAVSFAAQAMIYIGFVDEHNHSMRTAMLYSIGLAAVLYVAFPSFLSRVITCFAALQITLLWIQVGDRDPISPQAFNSDYYPLLTLAFWTFHLAAICWTLLRPRQAIRFAPLGYALVTSLAVWQAENLGHIWEDHEAFTYQMAMVVWASFWARIALVALTLFGVVVWAAGGRNVWRQKEYFFLGLGLALAVLVYLGLGSVLVALLFVLLGFALQDRVILGLGLLLFPVFLGDYYYNLDLDLLAKSGVLITSGFVMLLLRTGVTRGVFMEKKTA
jgi:Domain of unknown function (DUF4401)